MDGHGTTFINAEDKGLFHRPRFVSRSITSLAHVALLKA
jgi:hypothetical protein